MEFLVSNIFEVNYAMIQKHEYDVNKNINIVTKCNKKNVGYHFFWHKNNCVDKSFELHIENFIDKCIQKISSSMKNEPIQFAFYKQNNTLLYLGYTKELQGATDDFGRSGLTASAGVVIYNIDNITENDIDTFISCVNTIFISFYIKFERFSSSLRQLIDSETGSDNDSINFDHIFFSETNAVEAKLNNIIQLRNKLSDLTQRKATNDQKHNETNRLADKFDESNTSNVLFSKPLIVATISVFTILLCLMFVFLWLFSPIDKGLIAYYPLDGNANCKNGAHNGEIRGHIEFVNGINGKAAFFNGKNSFVNIEKMVNFDTNEFTINTWIKADNYKQFARIINKGQASNAKDVAGYSLRIVKPSLTDSKKYELWFDVINKKLIRVRPKCLISALKSDQFNMITGRLRKSEEKIDVQLFLNSELIDSKPLENIGSLDSNIPLAIGALHIGGDKTPSEIFNGYIDDVRIYSRALSDKEIKNLYNAFEKKKLIVLFNSTYTKYFSKWLNHEVHGNNGAGVKP